MFGEACSTSCLSGEAWEAWGGLGRFGIWLGNASEKVAGMVLARGMLGNAPRLPSHIGECLGMLGNAWKFERRAMRRCAVFIGFSCGWTSMCIDTQFTYRHDAGRLINPDQCSALP